MTMIELLERTQLRDLESRIIFAVSPLIFTSLLSITGMVLVMLPATVFLSAHHCETLENHTLCGLVGGAVIGVLFAIVLGNDSYGLLIFGALGAISGLPASGVWGRHRMKPSNSHRSSSRSNPVHDLLF
ncbi:hypothetical protein GCM10011411_24330 [Aurantiacibacter arachoides]|nr:hypothetical protein GCM10011411_24330 [Aurantiacibacter arachoides]